MSLLNRLRPKWQNSDPEVRIEAVRTLDKDDVELLTAVAMQDPDARVRRVAIRKIDSPRTLLSIARDDEDEGVRSTAAGRASRLLVAIACDSRDAEESMRALELIESQADVANVVAKAHFDDVREQAFARITEESAFGELALKTKDPALEKRALERIADVDVLKSLVGNDSKSELAQMALARIEDPDALDALADQRTLPKPIRQRALAKLLDRVDDDHPRKVEARLSEYREIVAEAEALAAEAPAPDASEKLSDLQRRFGELESKGAPSPDLEERYLAARAALAPPVEAAPPPEPTRARDSVPETPETSSADEVETWIGRLSADDVSRTVLEEARAAVAGLAPDEKLLRRFEAAAGRAEKKLDEQAQAASRAEEIPALLEEMLRAVSGKDPDEAARKLAPLKKRFHALEAAADAEAKTRFAHVEERLQALKEKARLEREKREQENLLKIQEQIKKLEKLTSGDDLSLKEATRALRASQDLLKNMGPLAPSINRKKMRRELDSAREALFKKTQQFRDLESWKRWANADIQAALIERVEALRESRDLPKVRKELREIHEEWKKAGTAPAEKAEELWSRYKSIRDELNARCDAFFAKQDEERGQNLEKKEKLCEQVEALMDSEDWNKTAEAIKKIQAEWKSIGPVPKKKSDAIWKRFRKACDHFFERRKAHLGERRGELDANLKKKRELCEQAEALKDSMEWRSSVDAFKRFQAEWRKIGPVPRKHADAVWKRFKTACDHFFDRFKRKDEVEAESRASSRTALLERAEALLQSSPEMNELVPQVGAIWSEWKKLGPTPDSQLELQRSFEQAISRLVALDPGAFENTELDPKTSRKKREKLVVRMEALVEELAPKSASTEELDELERLAERLKDALASNTMTGGKGRDPKQSFRRAHDEVRRLNANWLRAAPVPGDEGRELGQRFQAAYRSFIDQKKALER